MFQVNGESTGLALVVPSEYPRIGAQRSVGKVELSPPLAEVLPTPSTTSPHLSTRLEIFALGQDTLVVVHVVLPAVLGPEKCVRESRSPRIPHRQARTGFGSGSGRRSQLQKVSAYLTTADGHSVVREKRTSHELERLGDISAEFLRVGQLDVGHCDAVFKL